MVDPSLSLRDRLLSERKALLDLGTRNRLIHIPLRTRNIRAIQVVDELSTQVFSTLSEGKGFTFLPGRGSASTEVSEADEEPVELMFGQPGDEEPDESRHTDTRLQTRLTSEGLQKRLFDIWYDSRTLEEEQGVNILFLAFGLLKWFEDDKSDVERYAPLVLLPVRLDRSSAAERFTLKSRNEPPSANLSLQAKMNGEFGLRFEDLPEDDDVDLASYFSAIAKTVAGKTRWQVLPDAMVLGFFSFAKFLMYRDLDPENWPTTELLEGHEVISALLRDGFEPVETLFPDEGRIDPYIPPATKIHVVNADSSQSVAIEETVKGRHLVVKGPPGTGKSQTITNIIAAAAADGKKILFVAEKMAALDVVHRRLKSAGLSALTLELHSSKANKKSILEELRRTKEQALSKSRADTTVIQRLTDVQNELNAHADRMHERQEPSGFTPYQLLGQLLRVRGEGGLPNFAVSEPESWTPTDFRRRKELLQEISERAQSIGPPGRHPWRGVGRDALDPSELDALRKRLSEIRIDLHSVIENATAAARIFGYQPPLNFGAIRKLLRVLATATSCPTCDYSALANPAWADHKRITETIDESERFIRLRNAVDSAYVDSAWNSSLGPCRQIVAMKGNSLFRALSSEYRAQIALLRSYIKVPLPPTLEKRLQLIDGLLAAQAAREAFERAKGVGASAFGSLWRDDRTNWNEVRRLVGWWQKNLDEQLPSDFLERLSAVGGNERLSDHARALHEIYPQLAERLTSLQDFLRLDLTASFAAQSWDDVSLSEFATRLEEWQDTSERITRWIAFAERCEIANTLGLTHLIDGLRNDTIDIPNLVPTFEKSYFEALRGEFFRALPALKRFDGEHHSREVERFKSFDSLRIDLAREQIAERHSASLPRAAGGIGPLGVLNGEFAKRRNHLPLRQLLERAGTVIQDIKPVFLMSPLSVAQFLKPGTLSFDLLVMDEASQIEPVDAFGAIARSKQIVVVGDERQLPPTKFFSKLTSDIDENEDDDDVTFRAKDAESVLDLCLAKGMHHRMLNWHYRSKHQSLIAVSNQQFYENRLFIVPSPYDAVAGMGLKFNYLPHATYDRGGTRTNAIEAKAVAEAVIRHAQSQPDVSLGVATFSVAQRQAILNELELLRRAHPGTEEFFSKTTTEPFFVKNLENIQGDERDIIFISVGYGKNNSGYMAMSFGPLNSDGGERRLNVLISRAKLRCEVFSSITGDDIDLERARTKGVAALKMFLSFAQTGKLGIAEQSGRDTDSPFEDQVMQSLVNLGFDVKPQIGTAGFFVDLAISDPERPGRFALGIECDGMQYHSSRSARDRDRLRQSVLEDHGWVIHRIWSTDWYLRPDEEIRKVQAAYEAARSIWKERDDGLAAPPRAVPLDFTSERDGDTDVIIGTVGTIEEISAQPYEEAAFNVRSGSEPHEVPPAEMAKYVFKIVETEGPVHESEIVMRIRDAWGLGRAGNRIRDAVQNGINLAARQGQISGGPFYSIPGRTPTIRDRARVQSAGLRKPENLPPEEIHAATLKVIDENYGAPREQLIVTVARLFGFLSTSSQLRTILDHAVEELLRDGRVSLDREQLVRSRQR